MRKISPSITVLTTFTAVLLVGFWWQVLPRLQEFGQLRQAINKQIETQKQETLSASNQAKPNASKEKSTYEQAISLLPADDSQYDFSSQVEALSKSLNIPLTSFSLGAGGATAVGTATGVQRITFSISLSANYADTQRFVTALTSIDRFVQIDQISLTGSTSVSNAISTQITGFAYYLPSS